jgi:predicted Zn-dependent protease
MTASSRIVRAVIAGVALVVCAWFALGIREAHEVTVATQIVSSARAPTSAALRSAAGELSSAAFLDPDRTVDILRGRVAIKQGRIADARRILSAVTREEPRDLEAWIWFTGASLGTPQARVGTAQIAQLDPLDARKVGR